MSYYLTTRDIYREPSVSVSPPRLICRAGVFSVFFEFISLYQYAPKPTTMIMSSTMRIVFVFDCMLFICIIFELCIVYTLIPFYASVLSSSKRYNFSHNCTLCVSSDHTVVVSCISFETCHISFYTNSGFCSTHRLSCSNSYIGTSVSE